MDKKDRLGTTLQKKERAEENQYFAQRDQELIAKLKEQHEAEHEDTVRELARARCPRCGDRLTIRTLQEVEIDECPSCQGMWLDKGELEALGHQKGSGWMKQFLEGLGQVLTGSKG